MYHTLRKLTVTRKSFCGLDCNNCKNYMWVCICVYLHISFTNYLYFTCLYVLSACMCLACECLVSVRPEEDIRSFGSEVKEVCVSKFGHCELNLGTTEECQCLNHWAISQSLVILSKGGSNSEENKINLSEIHFLYLSLSYSVTK